MKSLLFRFKKDQLCEKEGIFGVGKGGSTYGKFFEKNLPTPLCSDSKKINFVKKGVNFFR